MTATATDHGTASALASWRERWRTDARVRSTARALLEAGDGDAVRAGSVYGSAQGLVLGALPMALRAPLLVVTLGPEEADDVVADLEAFLEGDPAGERIHRFRAWESLASDEARPSHAVFGARLEGLQLLGDPAERRNAVIVAPVAAILQPVPPPDVVAKAGIALRCGQEIAPERLEEKFTAAGLERVPMVELPGEWSRRGGIIDVYPIGGAGPFRVDYFGDEIDSIRTFDSETQRSLERLAEVRIALAPLSLLDPARHNPPEHARRPAARRARSLLDHLPDDGLVCVVEPERVEGMARELRRRFQQSLSYLEPDEVLGALAERRRLEISALPFAPGRGVTDFGTRSVERANGTNVGAVVEALRHLHDQGRGVTVLAPREAERTRFEEILAEGSLAAAGPAEPARTAPGPDAAVELGLGFCRRGFDDPVSGRTLLTTHELFRRALARKPTRRRRAKTGRAIQSFLELKVGDLIVHLVHGIGRFLGIERLDGEGSTEHLALQYANDVKVYVPVTKIELVQRYVGAKGMQPKLSTIGGTLWRKQKAKAKAAVMDLAADLLQVQAARDLERGTSYPDDDTWQSAFEAGFPYDDTPDQVDANDAIKKDMQAGRPMDRLICGDVGYGKTELAMRAAFKAAHAGRQVAVLVPTTVLAEQHHETFSARFAEFPLEVACLNRFRKGPVARRIIKRITTGEAQVVIGTHRLLSKDVKFRDLGLVIIDEEQRFGVAHKERLKHLRKTVDVLTLTATPIPRTLHMALLGIKDISALETAPEGRLSIRTLIARAQPGLIREAMLRELSREGQVFFVHNRVKTIAAKARELEKLVPEARMTIVHGQMDEELLARRMMAFVKGDVDVLVTTTIIESGLDIPRANTIFIDRADHFGLAELHQLRGRVGRYMHRAHAYMLLPLHGKVSEVGAKRLKAIEEFSELGSGFRIAMRDLEIRGAGNLLGPQQSGFIAQVGYDLYCRLLEQAIAELRAAGFGKDTPRTPSALASDRGRRAVRRAARGDEERVALDEAGLAGVEVELKLAARLPERYVQDQRQRIDLYRKLGAAHELETLAGVEDEMRDRFGKPSAQVRQLVDLHRLRILCEQLRIVRVGKDGKVAILEVRGNGALLREHLIQRRAKARWPEARTCFLYVASKPNPPDQKVLRELLKVLRPPKPRR